MKGAEKSQKKTNKGGLRSQFFSSHTAVIKSLTGNLFHASSEAGLLPSREWKIYLSTKRGDKERERERERIHKRKPVLVTPKLFKQQGEERGPDSATAYASSIY